MLFGGRIIEIQILESEFSPKFAICNEYTVDFRAFLYSTIEYTAKIGALLQGGVES